MKLLLIYSFYNLNQTLVIFIKKCYHKVATQLNNLYPKSEGFFLLFIQMLPHPLGSIVSQQLEGLFWIDCAFRLGGTFNLWKRKVLFIF